MPSVTSLSFTPEMSMMSVPIGMYRHMAHALIYTRVLTLILLIYVQNMFMYWFMMYVCIPCSGR